MHVLRLWLLVLFTLLTIAPVQAQFPQSVYLPLVAASGVSAPPPPQLPPIEELPPVDSSLYLYGAVQQSPVADKYGDLWLLLYPIRNPEPGARLARLRLDTNQLEYLSGRLSNGPRGALALGCDGRLYALIYDEDDKYIQHLFKINAYPGPPFATTCSPRSPRLERSANGWQVTP